MKKIFSTAILGLITLQAFSQRCATDAQLELFKKENPQLSQIEEMSNFQVRKAQESSSTTLRKSGVVRYIPVVFHVIHKWGAENVSQQQLQDAIRVLNEDFRKKAGTNGGTSTDALAVDMEYEFRIAQYDPNGNPTSGVNRIYSTQTDNARDAAKSISYWDARKYLNIWVVNTIQNTTGDPNSIVLGYAQFPFMLNSNPSTDGLVLRSDQLGVIEIGRADQAGRTLTHEAGHWVGLYHPFQGGCVGGTASNCASQGDQVCDTPPVESSTSGCPTSRNSCSNDVPNLPDLVKNYMDYADGTCMNMFTSGQKQRADASMNSFRANIYGSSNLSAAGLNTDGTYKPLTASNRKAPYTFGFNSNEVNGSGWTIENYTSPGDSGWNISSQAVLSGNGAMRSRNLLNNRLGSLRNAFSSPSIDISTLSNPTLTFYLAYAKRISASNCRLRVYISNDFGRTETLVKTYSVSEMETGPQSTTEFVPTASQWKKMSLDLTAYKSYTNCRIRFEIAYLRGNNIYIDDFSISEPTDLAEVLKKQLEFACFPNPSAGNFTISFQNPETQNIRVEIADLNGRILFNKMELNAQGPFEMGLQAENWTPGFYLLRVHTNQGIITHRLIKE
ncbi:hypothetical protein MASR2M44_02620 [Bacteroidota bacterium]